MTADIFGADLPIVILIAVVVLFGSTQIPKLARSLGSAQAEFKKGISEGHKASDEKDQKEKDAQNADGGSTATGS